MNITPSRAGTKTAKSNSFPNAVRYIIPFVKRDTTGKIQKIIPNALGFCSFCFLSKSVNNKQTKCNIKVMAGKPKTAKTFPLNPSAFPSAPQWVVIVSGNIEVHCEDTSFTINATYWSDLEIDYSEVDTIEYRKDLDVGVRTNGFGSARLLMGIFQNDEFGSYTLYAYTGAKEFVVLTSGTKTLVIGMNDVEDTQAIYDTMLEKIGE